MVACSPSPCPIQVIGLPLFIMSAIKLKFDTNMPLAVDIGVRVNMVPSTVNVVVAGVEGSGFKMSPT